MFSLEVAKAEKMKQSMGYHKTLIILYI